MEITENVDNKVLLKKVFDAGANTIWEEMKKLRNKAVEKKDAMRRRWIWELIQNASDCVYNDKKINIDVSVKDNKSLEFTHDGCPFTYENLIDLVTQISSKQSAEEEKTGKFGTGFISTHLLSEKVEIESSFKQGEHILKKLDFVIDRSGETYREIRESIGNTLLLIETLKNDDSNILEGPIDKYTTKFKYNCLDSEEIQQAIKTGLEDLNETAPFVLALNKSISTLTCNGTQYKVDNCIENEEGQFRIVEVSKQYADSEFCHKFSILIKSENEVSIVILVENIVDDKYKVLPYTKDFTKLFCCFPLIGTESFSFPVVINCSEFEVEKDRNAIHEGSEQNKHILKIAIKLYRELMNYAYKKDWLDIYNLCFMKKNNDSSIQKSLYERIEKIYTVMPIVDVNLNGEKSNRTTIKIQMDGELKSNIRIPICDKEELNDEFWELVNSCVDVYIPTKESYLKWNKIIDSKITIDKINNHYLKDKSMDYLKKQFNGNYTEAYLWLNTFYSFWIKSKGKDNFKENAFVLNQGGNFVKVSEIIRDDNIDITLKSILSHLGDNISKKLLSKEITLSEEIIEEKMENEQVTAKIQKKINQLLSDETINNTERSKDNQDIFNKLTDWFLENVELSEKLFDGLYNKRNLLSTPEENIRRFKIAEKIESNNIEYEELDDIIDNHNKIAELLENLGNLSDREIKEKLRHISIHSIYAKEKYKLILERTINRVYTYLSKNRNYEISSSLEKWKEAKYSETVFPASKKGKDIRIIIRPSDENKIIFFYEEELEALDDTNYELWTDDGQDHTRMITLGDIMKTTGITVIPLRNLYQ